MPWIEKKEGWLPGSGRAQEKRERQRPVLTVAEDNEILTISQAARMLGVDRQTIKKYLALEPGDDAPIPYEAWFRPNMGNIKGHIRIYKWAIIEIQTA